VQQNPRRTGFFSNRPKQIMSIFYELTCNSLQNKPVEMRAYEGKVVLVVNTASKCVLTPQYEGLQSLYNKYESEGLEILGFPCNQFANQEPGDGKQIVAGCLTNYGVTFPVFEKVEVNGPDAHPIFKYLSSAIPGFLSKQIKWNFTKFLIARDGNPIKRFAPTTKPQNLEADLVKALRS
jgi:glutathione peroxidase